MAKPKRSAILTIVSILAVGFVSGLLYATKLNKTGFHNEQISDSAKLADLKLKFANFSANDLEDYTRLKNLEERYKKADELVSKMILILLSDVGLRISSNQEAFVKTITATTKDVPVQTTPSTPPPIPTEAIQVPEAQLNWITAEKQLHRIENESDIAKLLSSTMISNFGVPLASSIVPAQNQIQKLISGCFSGDTIFTKTTKPKWEVYLEVHPLGASNGVPSSHIRVMENGEEIIGNSSDGELQAFRKFSNNSQALIVALNKKWYAQLYYLSSKDAYVGNLYRDEDLMKFEYKGTIRLTRNQNCN